MPAPTSSTIAACGLALIVLTALTGCSLSTASAHAGTNPAGHTPRPASSPAAPAREAGSASLTYGPGPQSPYTVQPQPAPGRCHYRYAGAYPLPDPACTPGALNPKVTPATLRSTICRSGYTASIRPPSAVTAREKAANARAYGYTGSPRTGEYDHLVSLELGGDPNDPRNLWVEPNDRPRASSTANSKDTVENVAHAAVCSGRLSLTAAQTGIATDWPALGRRLGVSLP